MRSRAFALFFLAFSAFAASDDPASVLVVVNDMVPADTGTGGVGASVYLGQYYASVRGIPSRNIVHISSPMACCSDSPLAYDSWNISFAAFQVLRQSIQDQMASLGLTTSVHYIVMIYGVPSHLLSNFEGTEQSMSLDSYIASMNVVDGNFPRVPRDYQLQANFYYAALIGTPPAHLKDFNWQTRGGYKMYAVCRLDGPTVAIVKAQIDNTILAEKGISAKSGIGYFDYRHINDPGGFDITMLGAYNACATRPNFRCVLHDQNGVGSILTSAPDALWAWGWYSGPTTNDGYTFALGAVGAQYTSYTANNIRGNIAGAWVPIWLTAGITATWGCTSEPFHHYTRGELVLQRMWAGFNFAEAVYSSTQHNSYMMVYLGDPLYKLNIIGPTAIKGGGRLSGGATLQ